MTERTFRPAAYVRTCRPQTAGMHITFDARY